MVVSSQKTNSTITSSARTRQASSHEHQDEAHETSLVDMTFEIAAGINDNDCADTGDQQREGQAEPVDQETE